MKKENEIYLFNHYVLLATSKTPLKAVVCRFGYGKADEKEVRTGVKVLVNEWDKATQKVINTPKANAYNKKIATVVGEITNIELGAKIAYRGKIDATYIKSVFEGKDRPNFGIVGLWEQSIEVKKSALEKTRNTPESLNNDNVKRKRLVRFLATLGKTEILISDIDAKFCIDFGNYLNSIVSESPAGMTYARFKMLLSVQVDLGNISRNFAKSHSMPRGKTKKFVWLTYKEVLKIKEFEFVGLAEKQKLTAFVCNALQVHLTQTYTKYALMR